LPYNNIRKALSNCSFYIVLVHPSPALDIQFHNNHQTTYIEKTLFKSCIKIEWQAKEESSFQYSWTVISCCLLV